MEKNGTNELPKVDNSKISIHSPSSIASDGFSTAVQNAQSTVQSLTETEAEEARGQSNNGSVTMSDASFINSKGFLLNNKNANGLNLYDHLVEVIKRILTQQPMNVLDVFEDYSSLTKRENFTSTTSTVRDDFETTTEAALAFVQKKLYDTAAKDDEEAAENEDEEAKLPDLQKVGYFVEQSGLGINREEMFRVWMALKELEKSLPLESIRFWGKLFGLKQNYYVAEVEFEEGEGEEIEEKLEEGDVEDIDEEVKPLDQEGAGEEGGEPMEREIPQPKWKPPPVVPLEPLGSGINRKVYYVCNEPGRLWTRLPKVTPAQIQCARLIKKYLTGVLDTPIISYPPFPGLELNYLRAQIARISSCTQVSPMGFYQFDAEEEEDDEEGMGQDVCVKNPGFEGLSLSELIDPSMENWVHHTKYLLPQGRCVWWNPKELDEEMAEEEDEEGPAPEIGLPLLQPLSEDKMVNRMPAWTAHISSKRTPQHAHAYIESNLWPGSSAFSAEEKSDNLYIGWSHKYSANNYSPPAPPPVMKEYKWGLELAEVDDPTPEEEAALKALLEPPQKMKGEEGEEQIEEEEEEEEEDED